MLLQVRFGSFEGLPYSVQVSEDSQLGTCSPYRMLLGEVFDLLPAHVRHAHEVPLVAEGTLDVEHGTHWLTPLMIHLMKLPVAARGQRVRLELMADGPDVIWMRRIGSSTLRTRQRAIGGRLIESNAIGWIAFHLAVAEDSVVYRQLAIGVGRVAIPSPIGPHVAARVSPVAVGWRVDVTVTWRGHLVCRYGGVLSRV